MTRLAGLEENQMVDFIKSMHADIDDIKNRQLAGRDIFVPKIVECLDGFGNPTQYDLVADTPDGFGGYELRQFIATMTADNQIDVWAVPIFKVYWGSPTTPAGEDQTAGFCYLGFPGTIDYQISYAGYFGDNVFPFDHITYLKVYFYATDSGTLSIVGNP